MHPVARWALILFVSFTLLGAGRGRGGGGRDDEGSAPPPKPPEAAPSPPVKLPTNAPSNAPKVPTTPTGSDARPAAASATGISLEAMVTMLQMRADAQRDRIHAMRQEIRELRAREDALIRQLEKQGVRADRPLLTLPPATQPAGATTRPTTQPVARQAEPARQGRRVVFVLDASASMSEEFGPVAAEVVKAVGGMAAREGFALIAVQDGDVIPLSEGFTPGGESGARQAQSFLASIQPAGAGDLLLGLGAAFRLRPDAIWLVSDGDFPGGDHTFALVQRLTTDRPAQINTLVCLDAAGNASGTPIANNLARLAREHGGTCLGFSPDRGPLGALIPNTEPLRPAAATAQIPLPTGPSVFSPQGPPQQTVPVP